jgi:hypothetical protein
VFKKSLTGPTLLEMSGNALTGQVGSGTRLR